MLYASRRMATTPATCESSCFVHGAPVALSFAASSKTWVTHAAEPFGKLVWHDHMCRPLHACGSRSAMLIRCGFSQFDSRSAAPANVSTSGSAARSKLSARAAVEKSVRPATMSKSKRRVSRVVPGLFRVSF